MGLLGGLAKAGIAKKAIDWGRRPENQRKIKDAVGRMSGKGSSGGGAPRR